MAGIVLPNPLTGAGENFFKEFSMLLFFATFGRRWGGLGLAHRGEAEAEAAPRESSQRSVVVQV